MMNLLDSNSYTANFRSFIMNFVLSLVTILKILHFNSALSDE